MGFRRDISLLLLGFMLLTACSAESFPDCCIGDGARRDAPFTTTYLFQFKTGTRDIKTPNQNRLLRIISEADILTLKNAASTSQLFDQGLIGGLIQGIEGPAKESAIQVTDQDGNIVGFTAGENRNLFYNSLGRVPDFLIDQGTGDEGTFTLFNAPPGELFFQAVRGGRGNGRITSFPNAVSKGQINILPVFTDKVGVLGAISLSVGDESFPEASSFFSGRTTGVPINEAGLFEIDQSEGLITEGNFLLSFKAQVPGFRETVHRFATDLAVVLGRQQAFGPLTISNITLFPETHLQNMASSVGIPLGPSWGIVTGKIKTEDGTSQAGNTMLALDAEGLPLDFKNGDQRLFFLDRSGVPAPAAASTSHPFLTATLDQTGFILFLEDCVSGQEITLYAYKTTVSLPIGVVTGQATSYCEPGKVFVQDVIIKSVPQEGVPADPPMVTVEVQGTVANEDGGIVSGANIEILGSSAAVVTADEDGNYTILAGPEGEVSPLISHGEYTMKTSLDDNFVPTYQSISTGSLGGERDLVLLQAGMKDLCLPSRALNIFGIVRDIGLIDPLRKGRAEGGISLEVRTVEGEKVGRVVYPEAESATSRSGEFAVCDLPEPDPNRAVPGLYQLRVSSPEDSGAILVKSRSDGVVVLSMVVNKSLPKEVNLRGVVQSLSGPETDLSLSVGDVSLSVLGSKNKVTADAAGQFILSLGSNSQYIVEVSKEGYLPAYNYQVESPAQALDTSLSPLMTLSKDALQNMALQAGVEPLPENGVLSGKVVVPGLASEGAVATLATAGLSDITAGFLDEDGHVDLLTVSVAGEVNLFTGDGTGGMIRRASPPCPDLLFSPEISETGDLNQDGRPDLAIISADSLVVFLGTRDGCYEKAVAYSMSAPKPEHVLPGNPRALQMVDLTGDGVFDLLVATDAAEPLVRLDNGGDAFFEVVPMEGRCGGNPVSVLARLNRARLIDIVIADSVKGVCQITYNADESALSTVTLLLPPPLLPEEIVAIKSSFFDQNAIPDLLLLSEEGGAIFLGEVPIDTNEILTFLPAFTFPTGFALQSADFVDLNRDRRADLIVLGEGGMLLLLGNGDGAFGVPTVVSALPISGIALADYNEDGKMDLVGKQGNDLVLFIGEDSAKEGIKLESRDEAGLTGEVFYVDIEGKVRVDWQETGPSGRFIIFNVPSGLAYVRGAEGAAGNAVVTSYESGLTFFHLKVNPIQPAEISLEGQVINPTVGEFAGIDVRGISVTPLGSGRSTFSGEEGRYQMNLGANSEYIIKLDP